MRSHTHARARARARAHTHTHTHWRTHGLKQARVHAHTRTHTPARAKINIIFITSSFYVRLVVDQIDVFDVIYVRFGSYLYKYFCLLLGPTVLLLMYCYI